MAQSLSLICFVVFARFDHGFFFRGLIIRRSSPNDAGLRGFDSGGLRDDNGADVGFVRCASKPKESDSIYFVKSLDFKQSNFRSTQSSLEKSRRNSLASSFHPSYSSHTELSSRMKRELRTERLQDRHVFLTRSRNLLGIPSPNNKIAISPWQFFFPFQSSSPRALLPWRSREDHAGGSALIVKIVCCDSTRYLKHGVHNHGRIGRVDGVDPHSYRFGD